MYKNFMYIAIIYKPSTVMGNVNYNLFTMKIKNYGWPIQRRGSN